MSLYQYSYNYPYYYPNQSQLQPQINQIPGQGNQISQVPISQVPISQVPIQNQVSVPVTNQVNGYYPNNYIQLPFYYYSNIEKKSKSSTTWTQKEDKLLRELKEHQKLGWREISTFFNDRTPNACQFRWRRIISSINGKTNSRSSSISSISSVSSASSLSSNSSSPILNKKTHHSINYILN
ncbi:hypothetical protein CLIB1444_09S02762 [[Candida] jaroonii]|uniref:Uncharacterized protein n=1 Tax=[Candida] jaroonii TaxID=467808 RepID=A0ACA9YBF0_9ASCO|nr:hypothetical protein CLIB1444_09S02762 [[Candida] jaroonii]